MCFGTVLGFLSPLSCSRRLIRILACRRIPSPFLGYLPFYTADPHHKTRYPKEEVAYEPLGGPEQTLNHETLRNSQRSLGCRLGLGLQALPREPNTP